MRVFVHRYKWSHCNRRKQLRRLHKDGLAALVLENNQGWLYQVPDNFKVKQG